MLGEVLIRILGIIVITLFCLIGGGLGGIIISYTISKTESHYAFSYAPAIVFGVVFGVCGCAYAFEELWKQR